MICGVAMPDAVKKGDLAACRGRRQGLAQPFLEKFYYKTVM
jgi:hypothetical protein